MRTIPKLALVVLLSVPAVASAEAPAGWFLAGSDPGSYQISRDSDVTHDGKASGRLASTKAPNRQTRSGGMGFGTLMQSFDAGEYVGKRLRLSAWVRSKDVEDWAGVWMRVDGEQTYSSLAFDNMQNRPIKGTTDWKKYEVVLDVAEAAKGIYFGILVSGEGTVWINDVRFEVVDKSVPVTGFAGAGPKLKRPTNLDFGN
jgi:hypothetical protein